MQLFLLFFDFKMADKKRCSKRRMDEKVISNDDGEANSASSSSDEEEVEKGFNAKIQRMLLEVRSSFSA